MFGKVLSVDLVDLSKLGDVCDKDVDLDDLVKRRARSSKDALEVGKDLVGKDLDVGRLDELSFGSQRDLARKVDETVALDSLGVGTDGLGSVFGEDLETC